MRCVHLKPGRTASIRCQRLRSRAVNRLSLRRAGPATKQSRGSRTHTARDCFAPLAMTARAASMFASVVGIGAAPAAATTCASLASLALPHTTITVAQSVQAGTYTAPDGEVFTGLPAFCRVAATLTPTSDSDIKIEVWMPFSDWNGRFLGTGNGGIGGVIKYLFLAHFLPLKYAVANTDLGTSPAATDPHLGRVLTGHPEKQIDYATRSTNLMTVRSKQIIEAFYGGAPKYSYFSGCSTGGAEALHEALQFPSDYDGIVAGAPVMNNTHISASVVWNYKAFNGAANISAIQANAITAAIVKQCRQRRRFELGQFSNRPTRLPLGSGCTARHGRGS